MWCNSIVNNYLVSIAARTLNPAPPVRPRLGGRFDPASISRERSIDRPESSRPNAAKPSRPDSDRELAGPMVSTEQGDPDNHLGIPLDLTPELHRSAALTPEVNTVAAPSSPAPDFDVDPSPPITIHAPKRQTIGESPQQNTQVEVRPVEKVIDASERVGSRRETPPESRSQTRPETRFEELTSKSVPNRAAEEEAPTPRQRSSKTIRASSSGDDEEQPIARPAIARKKPVIERELETIIIREKPILDESARQNQSIARPLPMEVSASSHAKEDEDSKAPRVFVQSHIAPLIETGPEHLSLNRTTIQPQPTVHVTIGRIEVRAVQSSQSPARPRAATTVMNLDDYLRRRSQGGA
jgi:hypothetical protein